VNRIEKFYELPEFGGLAGLPEELVRKEEELNESIGEDFVISVTTYNVANKNIYLGKINSWYFLGGPNNSYDVFEDKKLILLYIKQKFDETNESKSEEEQVDSSWKGFWTREIESL